MSTALQTDRAAPYYVPVADEVEVFRAAYRQGLSILLKGPTGCGKTRFVEARQDTTVVLHPLADHRRRLPIERLRVTLDAQPGFRLVVSYNPGYQSVLKDLEDSTRQRMVAIQFDYPEPDIEQSIVVAESGVAPDRAAEPARLRREEPVQRIDMSTMPGDDTKPLFIAYRHGDIRQILRDNETFSSAIIIQAFGDVLGRHVMLGMDEPEHGRHRALVSKAFTQKALARWEDGLVGRVGNDLIDRFAAAGSADLVKEFTFPYRTQIIAGLLGLPREDFRQFQQWSISLLRFTVNPERGKAASLAVEEYFAPILAARRDAPHDDVISRPAVAEIDGQRLSDGEIFSFLRLLLPAGVETTYRSLGNLLFGLFGRPDQLAAVRVDRSLIPQAIEEAVRWEAPLLTITRVATRDTELSGLVIPAGSSVMPMLGAANREEDRYDEPDSFDIFRPARPSISWGHGAHVCLGMPLARLEMRVAIELLLDRLPELRLDPAAEDPHIRGQVFRSPASLPVLFNATGAAS